MYRSDYFFHKNALQRMCKFKLYFSCYSCVSFTPQQCLLKLALECYQLTCFLASCCRFNSFRAALISSSLAPVKNLRCRSTSSSVSISANCLSFSLSALLNSPFSSTASSCGKHIEWLQLYSLSVQSSRHKFDEIN